MYVKVWVLLHNMKIKPGFQKFFKVLPTVIIRTQSLCPVRKDLCFSTSSLLAHIKYYSSLLPLAEVVTGICKKKGMICLNTAAQNKEQAVFLMWKYLIFWNLLINNASINSWHEPKGIIQLSGKIKEEWEHFS